MTFDVLSVAGPATVGGALRGSEGRTSEPAAIPSGVGDGFMMPNRSVPRASFVAPAGRCLVLGGDTDISAARGPDGSNAWARCEISGSRPPDDPNRPVEAEPCPEQVLELSEAVDSLDVHSATRPLGEAPLTDDALGAGGDLQVGVGRSQRFGLLNVTVPIDIEAHQNLLRRHLVRLDLPAPSDLHPTAAHGPIRREELFLNEIVWRALPDMRSLGNYDWGWKLAWSVALFYRGLDLNGRLWNIHADSACRVELIAQSCEPGTGQFG
jgi:hypothetical protein